MFTREVTFETVREAEERHQIDLKFILPLYKNVTSKFQLDGVRILTLWTRSESIWGWTLWPCGSVIFCFLDIATLCIYNHNPAEFSQRISDSHWEAHAQTEDIHAERYLKSWTCRNCCSFSQPQRQAVPDAVRHESHLQRVHQQQLRVHVVQQHEAVRRLQRLRGLLPLRTVHGVVHHEHLST